MPSFRRNKEMRMLNAIRRGTLKVPCRSVYFPALEEMNQRREEELLRQNRRRLQGRLGRLPQSYSEDG